MRMTASWFGSWTHRIQGCGAIDSRPESGLPSDRHPDRIERAAVLGAVKAWPGKRRARGKAAATANLDSSCARRLCNTCGSGHGVIAGTGNVPAPANANGARPCPRATSMSASMYH